MDTTEKHFEDLHEIRSLMERSGRFISLSGLSGICAGVFALAGAFITWRHFGFGTLRSTLVFRTANENIWFLVEVAGSVLILSFISGFFFTTRNAKKKGEKIWDATSRFLLINLAIPLAVGGIFRLILLGHSPELIASAMLIFYGLSLLNAGKYTLKDIRYLGISEIILGLICGFNTGYGLLFWAIGFGALHVVYGTVMYFKYER